MYSRQREHDDGEGYESPLDTLVSAVERFEQGGHAFEEQHDEHPWNKPNERGEHGEVDLEAETLALTVGNRANEISGKYELLLQVHFVRYLWSIRTFGPRYVPIVRHCSGVHERGGFRRRAG